MQDKLDGPRNGYKHTAINSSINLFAEINNDSFADINRPTDGRRLFMLELHGMHYSNFLKCGWTMGYSIRHKQLLYVGYLQQFLHN